MSTPAEWTPWFTLVGYLNAQIAQFSTNETVEKIGSPPVVTSGSMNVHNSAYMLFYFPVFFPCEQLP